LESDYNIYKTHYLPDLFTFSHLIWTALVCKDKNYFFVYLDL